jgi:hypothetical protein
MARIIRFQTVHVGSSLVILTIIYLNYRHKTSIEIKIEIYQTLYKANQPPRVHA